MDAQGGLGRPLKLPGIEGGDDGAGNKTNLLAAAQNGNPMVPDNPHETVI